MTKRIAALFAVALLLGAEPPTDAGKEDLKKLQGGWKVEKGVRAGKVVPTEKVSLKVDGNLFSISDEDSAREERAEVTLDPTTKPPAIEIQPKQAGENVRKGIYKLDGDTLTMCWSRGGERPTEFASKEGSDHVLLVLKRVKK